jgi:hypothetical protein
MDLDYFMAGGLTDRCFAFDHELAAHEDLCPVCIFVTVQKFARDNAAEFFNLVDITINCLLENLIYHFKIPREVSTLKGAGQIDIDVERGNKNNRALFMPVYLHEFLNVLDSDPGQVNANIRRRCLDIGQILAESLFRGMIVGIVFNRSSHPDGFSNVLL